MVPLPKQKKNEREIELIPDSDLATCASFQKAFSIYRCFKPKQHKKLFDIRSGWNNKWNSLRDPNWRRKDFAIYLDVKRTSPPSKHLQHFSLEPTLIGPVLCGVMLLEILFLRNALSLCKRRRWKWSWASLS